MWQRRVDRRGFLINAYVMKMMIASVLEKVEDAAFAVVLRE